MFGVWLDLSVFLPCPLLILTMFEVSRHIKFHCTQLFVKSVDIIGRDLLINGELFSFFFVISISTNRARSYVNVSCQTYGRVSLITLGESARDMLISSILPTRGRSRTRRRNSTRNEIPLLFRRYSVYSTVTLPKLLYPLRFSSSFPPQRPASNRSKSFFSVHFFHFVSIVVLFRVYLRRI